MKCQRNGVAVVGVLALRGPGRGSRRRPRCRLRRDAHLLERRRISSRRRSSPRACLGLDARVGGPDRAGVTGSSLAARASRHSRAFGRVLDDVVEEPPAGDRPAGPSSKPTPIVARDGEITDPVRAVALRLERLPQCRSAAPPPAARASRPGRRACGRRARTRARRHGGEKPPCMRARRRPFGWNACSRTIAAPCAWGRVG